MEVWHLLVLVFYVVISHFVFVKDSKDVYLIAAWILCTFSFIAAIVYSFCLPFLTYKLF